MSKNVLFFLALLKMFFLKLPSPALLNPTMLKKKKKRNSRDPSVILSFNVTVLFLIVTHRLLPHKAHIFLEELTASLATGSLFRCGVITETSL